MIRYIVQYFKKDSIGEFVGPFETREEAYNYAETLSDGTTTLVIPIREPGPI